MANKANIIIRIGAAYDEVSVGVTVADRASLTKDQRRVFNAEMRDVICEYLGIDRPKHKRKRRKWKGKRNA